MNLPIMSLTFKMELKTEAPITRAKRGQQRPKVSKMRRSCMWPVMIVSIRNNRRGAGRCWERELSLRPAEFFASQWCGQRTPGSFLRIASGSDGYDTHLESRRLLSKGKRSWME
jgi:hypothetical protein